MDVKEYKENEDGSATIKLELTGEEVAALLDYAIEKLLHEAIKEVEEVK